MNSRYPTKEEVAYVKATYPAGTRIRLSQMSDPQAVPAGTEGTVVHVDSLAQISMKWDNGRTLSLVPFVDKFQVISPQEQKESEAPEQGGMGGMS